MRYLALLLMISGFCAAQQTGSPACPVVVSVAGSDVPLQGGNHMVLWFTNQSSKVVSGTQFKLFLLDGTGSRSPVSDIYYAAWETMPGAGGIVVKPAKDEEKYFGSAWRNARGLEVEVSRVFFSDGTEWQPAASACRSVFMNAAFVHDMREWNRQLRADWNRSHPHEAIPGGPLAAWLDPKSDGWR